MKVKFLQVLAISTLLMNSCAKDSVEAESTNTAIQFDGKINNLKATTSTGPSTSWVNGDQIGIFMVNTGTNTIAENSSNRVFIYGTTSFAALAGQDIFYPVNDTKVDFISYYPYSSTASLASTLPINVGDQSNLAKIDYLYAKSNNGNLGFNKTMLSSVPLNFEHKLAKIVIVPVAGQGFLPHDIIGSQMQVKIKGMNTVSSLNLSTGLLGASNTQSDITPFVSAPGIRYDAIVLPSTFATAGTLSFTFQVGNNTYVWTNPANETFEAGKEYTYSITLQKTGLILGTVSVKDWVNVYRSGTAL